jgi:hypothetical protein
MFKKSVSIVLLASFLSCIVASCGDNTSTQPRERVRTAGDPGWLERELSTAPEVRDLIEIRDEIVLRAVERGVTSEQLREAVSSGPRSNEVLGLSSLEAKEIQDRMVALIGSLCDRYTVLGDLVAREISESMSGGCDLDRFVDAWDAYSARIRAELSSSSPGTDQSGAGDRFFAPAHEPLKCKWAQLTIGFAVCAVKSGGSLLVYAVCSYGVFCGSCEGGISDALCR